MARNPPEGTPRIVARLAYDDPEAAIAFLERAFGFEERRSARIETTDGAVALTEMEVGDSHLMVGTAGAHGLASPRDLGAVTQALIVFVDGIDQHFDRARAGGAAIVSPPQDQFWGDRRYEARDPEGHLWSFHEHLRDVPQQEIDAALASLGRPT